MTRLLQALGAGAGGMFGAGLAGACVLTRPQSTFVRTETYDVPRASRAQAHALARLRVFFAHKSVGANILDGLPAVFQAVGIKAPPVTSWEEGMTVAGTGVVHTPIGSNGDLSRQDRGVRKSDPGRPRSPHRRSRAEALLCRSETGRRCRAHLRNL